MIAHDINMASLVKLIRSKDEENARLSKEVERLFVALSELFEAVEMSGGMETNIVGQEAPEMVRARRLIAAYR